MSHWLGADPEKIMYNIRTHLGMSDDKETQVVAAVVCSKGVFYGTNAHPHHIQKKGFPSAGVDKYPYMVHAEMQVIQYGMNNGECTLIVTQPPCDECLKNWLNVRGLKRIVMMLGTKPHHVVSDIGTQMLLASDVEVVSIPFTVHEVTPSILGKAIRDEVHEVTPAIIGKDIRDVVTLTRSEAEGIKERLLKLSGMKDWHFIDDEGKWCFWDRGPGPRVAVRPATGVEKDMWKLYRLAKFGSVK